MSMCVTRPKLPLTAACPFCKKKDEEPVIISPRYGAFTCSQHRARVQEARAIFVERSSG